VDKNQILVVNIPSANLYLFDHGKVGEETKIIVGKRTTPTPTLSSTVSEVVLYPYWNVPYKIATREMLPLIKRNPAYLEKNGFQVLNHLGKKVSASSISWNSLSVDYFPYTIRQSTGCDNALGLYKLNFYNPFSVYLHDTPGKYLFNMNKRYFSHGCMRMQRANEIAHYVLKGNEIAIDTLEEKGCLLQQQPIHVPVTNPLSVLVVYHTAWFDASGKVIFYEDVYHKNKF
jgi:murein L,D-transpeptidase YcbB/YkuD